MFDPDIEEMFEMFKAINEKSRTFKFQESETSCDENSEELWEHNPFQVGYDFPEMGIQLHLHGPDENTITYGKIVDYKRNIKVGLNGYESSMAVLRAEILGAKKFYNNKSIYLYKV